MQRLIVYLIAALSVFAAEDSEVIRQSFGAPEKLEVRNFNGGIRVIASNTPNIQLVATKKIRADDPSDLALARNETRLDIQESGGRLRICVIQPWEDCRDNLNRRRYEGDGRRRDYEARFDLELQIPARTEVDLSGINGGIDVSGLQAAFRVKTVNGSVTLTEMEGSGSADTVNGQVKLSFARVPIEGIDAKTVNGSIEAAFPRTMNARLNFKTFQGDVFTDFPTPSPTNTLRRNREFSVNIGTGGPEHHFETLNGRIQIAQR